MSFFYLCNIDRLPTSIFEYPEICIFASGNSYRQSNLIRSRIIIRNILYKTIPEKRKYVVISSPLFEASALHAVTIPVCFPFASAVIGYGAYHLIFCIPERVTPTCGIPDYIPTMPGSQIRRVDIIIRCDRNPDRSHCISCHIASIPAISYPGGEKIIASKMGQGKICIIIKPFFFENLVDSATCVDNIRSFIKGIQLGHIVFVIFFSPVAEWLISYPVREDKFAKVIEREMLVPRIFFPDFKREVYILDQIIGSYYFGVIYFFSVIMRIGTPFIQMFFLYNQ